MSVDLSRPLKTAIVEHLASSPKILALVPAERIYAMAPPANPTWPFIRYGVSIATSFGATCWEGSSVRVSIHAFAQTSQTHAGEDNALDIAAAIVESMSVFDSPNLGLVDFQWLQTNCIMEDLEADRWHAICEFNVTVVTPS